jgi:UDP:flavonoid glycosyltransferase YjiC (YdhE family)
VKILLTSPAGAGHVLQMVPLAQAMVARGHDVLWAVPDRAAEQIEALGIPAAALPFPPPFYPGDMLARFPEIRDHPPAERPDHMFAKLFGATHAPPMLEGLAPLALDWRPDLVVSDAAELAGAIVAAEIGVPAVTKAFGALLPFIRYERAAQEVAPLWRSRGLEPRPYAGVYDHLYLDIYPPELQSAEVSRIPARQLMRPVTYSGSIDESAPLPLPAGRPGAPLVYVTMGTVFNDPQLFTDVVSAIAHLDVRVLVTVGAQGDPGILGDQPDHVRVETFVPQSVLLPHCAVVVSHAGSGTALATLEHGLPQLCLPQGADQFLNAAAISRFGAGLALAPDAASASAIGAAVERLLGEDAFRAAAERVGATIRGMPSPDDVVAVLEGLA